MSTGVKALLGAALVAGAVAIPLFLKSAGDTGRDSQLAVAAVSPQADTPCAAGQEPEVDGKCAAPGTSATVAADRRPLFVDLGTTTCAPCRVMLGVMEELEGSFPDTLAVEFVNVQHDADGLERYGVSVIPTQIFFTPDGRELFRHRGVMRTDAVAAKWKSLGYDLGTPVETN